MDWQELEKFDSEIAEALLTNPYGVTYDGSWKKTPTGIIDIFEQVLHERNIPILVTDTPEFHVRFKNLPKEKPYSVEINEIDSNKISNFLSTQGRVIKAKEPLCKLHIGLFTCLSCNQTIKILQDREDRIKGLPVEPLRCPDCGKMNSRGKKNFRLDDQKSDYIDFQIIEIQEKEEEIGVGEIGVIEVWLEDDLIDKSSKGDEVIVTGFVRVKTNKENSLSCGKFIEANNVEIVRKRK